VYISKKLQESGKFHEKSSNYKIHSKIKIFLVKLG